MLKSDKIVSPVTQKQIGKYESAWWKLIRLGWHEDILESLHLVEVQPVYMKCIKNISPSHLSTITRAGVIMLSTVRDQRLYGLGLDKTYRQLTDFAGGVRKNESAIDAALREFKEETYGLFYDIPADNVANAMAIYDKHHLVVFLSIDSSMFDIDDMNIAFHGLKKEHQGKIEIDDIIWITEEELKQAIHCRMSYIYSRLRNFLDKAGNFMDYL